MGLEQMMAVMMKSEGKLPMPKKAEGSCAKCGGAIDGATPGSPVQTSGKQGKGPPAPGTKGGKTGAPPVPGAADGAGGKGKGPPPPGPGGKGKDAKGKGKDAKGKGGAARGVDQWARRGPITPDRPMKPFWWTALKLGQNLVEGKTLWDGVEDMAPIILK